MSSIEPRLPPDLERAIFELAARTFRRRIPSFMLVAYRVYLWLKPIIYSRFYDIGRILDEDLALRVRSIMIPPEVYTSALNHAALALCTHTTHLALSPRFCDAKMLPVFAAMPNLRVLAFAPDKVFPVESDAAVAAVVQCLSGITHLELLTLPEARQDDFLSILRALPRLTHLALNRLPPLAWIRSLSPAVRISMRSSS